MEMEIIPVYVLTGFLDSGKTSVIKNTLSDPSFSSDGLDTLLIALEEGEVEYDEMFLAENNVELKTFESLEELTYTQLCALDAEYQPQQVFIELNGMENASDLFNSPLPDKWQIVQNVATIDASTFPVYVANMRSLVYEHCRYADMIVFNRCDANTKKSVLRGNVKAINPYAQIVYQSVDGTINQLPDDDLPFDLNADVIEIKDEDYGLWYMDAGEHPEKYDDKKVRFLARYAKTLSGTQSSIIIGRDAMVCCNNDTSLIGLTATKVDRKMLKLDNWYIFEGKLRLIHTEGSQDTLVLYVSLVTDAEEPENKYVTFS